MGMRGVTDIMRNTENIISIRALAVLSVILLGLAGCGTSSGAKKARLMSPLPDLKVISSFGPRTPTRMHKGIDLRATSGTPISAAAGGRVSFAGWQNGFGRIVIIDHGGNLQTYYAHMSDFAVNKGERVDQGETVGFVGQSGNATGPHLHFEVREKGKPVDPLLMLSTQPGS